MVAAYYHTMAAVWARWFPAWEQSDKSLLQRMVGGESYYTHAPLTVLVSVVAGALLIRHTRIVCEPRLRSGGIFLLGCLIVHLAGCWAGVTFVSAFSLVGALAAIILMLWGRRALRRLWFPLAMLLFAVPLPEVTIAELNFHLKMTAARWGVGLANALGTIAVQSGNRVFLEGGKELVIANVCSGLRTIISLLAFGALYVYICRLRGWWRGLLFALTLPVAFISNVARIAALILFADAFGAEAAAGHFHGWSGLMIFLLAVGMMFCLERVILTVQRFAGRSRSSVPLFHNARRGPEDADQWLRLRSALEGRAASAATAMIMLTAATAFYLNANNHAPSSAEHLKAVLPAQIQIGGQNFRGRDLHLDRRALTVLGTSDYLYRRYLSDRDPNALLDLCLIHSPNHRKGIHPPDLCLEGDGQNIVAKADVTVTGVRGRGDIPCRELIVQTGKQAYYYLYTYKCGRDYTRSFWRQQLVMLSNGLLSRNSTGALVRISTPVAPRQLETARNRAFALLRWSLPYVDAGLP
jgi:EpsI family protein